MGLIASGFYVIDPFEPKWSRDTSSDLLTQYLHFKMLSAMSSLCVPNFDSAPLFMPKL